MTLWLIFGCYIILMELIGFVVCGVDKHKAKKGKWRISEAAIIGIAALGGGLGVLAGMKLFRHKTKHKKFTVGVPLIIILHILILAAVIYLIYLA